MSERNLKSSSNLHDHFPSVSEWRREVLLDTLLDKESHLKEERLWLLVTDPTAGCYAGLSVSFLALLFALVFVPPVYTYFAAAGLALTVRCDQKQKTGARCQTH